MLVRKRRAALLLTPPAQRVTSPTACCMDIRILFQLLEYPENATVS
jgi:hypothetical protein